MSKERKPDLVAINESKKKETEHALLDRIYFWIIDRYTKFNHEFKFSDQFVWKGAVYVIPEIIGYLMFFAFFLFLAKIGFERYGEARTVVFFILLLIWRIQIGIKLISKINKKL
jgi:hypothetical protein